MNTFIKEFTPAKKAIHILNVFQFTVTDKPDD